MPRLGLLSRLAIAAGLLAGAMALPIAPFAPSAQAQDAKVSVNLFFSDLQPHGLWVRNARYTYVWCPRVSVRWRPYTQGHWVYIRDRGWYFQSDEPFAWAVYHYGRWIDDNDLGWCWVPGTHWAPAWVSWRRSKDYVGWAPLPPDSDGFAINIKVNVHEPPERDWVFVPVRSFVEPVLTASILFGDRDPEVFKRTQYVGPVVVQNNIVVNNVISLDFIKQETGRDVKIVDTKAVQDPGAVATTPAGGGTIDIFTPTLEPPKGDEAPKQVAEPEQAKVELAKERPPEVAAPNDQQAPPAGTEQATPVAPAGAAPAAQTPATTCPEGQELIDAKCVPLKPHDQNAAPAKEAVPTEPTPGAGSAAPAEPAKPTHKAAPKDNQAAPAEPLKCAADQEVVDGKCVPITKGRTKPSERPAASQDQSPNTQAAPSDQQAPPADQGKRGKKAAPKDNQAAPADQQLKCAADQEVVDGKCVPIAKSEPKPRNRPARSQDRAPNTQVAPSDQQAPAADQGKPAKCEPGFELIRNKCMPVAGEAAPAQ